MMYHHYPIHPTLLYYPSFMFHYPSFRQYPPVDIQIFSHSVKTFQFLMEQGSILLNRLNDSGFSHKLMSAAQEGKMAEVDRLIKSIGLKVPVMTKYTPTYVSFQLTSLESPQHPESCCTLKLSIKWGRWLC